MDETEKDLVIHHFFVDEAGDMTLFGPKGRVLVGTESCSKCFMLGVAQIPDPNVAGVALANLRANLLADPYFKGVPSMQSEQRKTAICFHAKDDLPEIRREVFKLLPSFGAKVQVAIRRKQKLVALAQNLRSTFPRARIRTEDVYDDLVARLFANLLDEAAQSEITFARRGKRERRKEIGEALARAQARGNQIGASDRRIHEYGVRLPNESPGLQVIDYYLWAVQRLYERGEDRFFEMLRPDYRLIIDADDRTDSPHGVDYTESNPLRPDKIKALF